MKTLDQLLSQAEQIRGNSLPNSNTANLVGDTLAGIVKNIQARTDGPVSGFLHCESIDELPVGDLTPVLRRTAYIISGHIYLYVATGGDTLDGLYQDCGEIRGPQGPVGPKGNDGVVLDGVSLADSIAAIEEAATPSETVPTANALNEVLYGFLRPVLQKQGYRIAFTDNVRGYYYAASSQSVFIFDVSKYKGKSVKFTRRRVANSYSYAFVTDYTLIPNASDPTTWESIFISGNRSNTADSTPLTSNVTIPENDSSSVFLCISFLTVGGCQCECLDASLVDKMEHKQDVLTFDNAPTSNSDNPVTSDGIYRVTKPLLGETGVLTALQTVLGYRLVYTSNIRGYYYEASSMAVAIYDVTALQGKNLAIRQTRSGNTYAYAFVRDYMQVGYTYDEETWVANLIVGLRENTSASSTYITRNVNVPSGESSVYLLVSYYVNYPCSVTDTAAYIAPMTVDDLVEFRSNKNSGSVSFSSGRIGIPPITAVKYDYNVIIGYGQSLSGGSGYQAYDLPEDNHAKMLYLRWASTGNEVTTRTLRNVSCVGSTASVQDFPPNASAVVDFAKLYRLKTGDNDRVFVHLCSAQGSMTIAQLMDFARYKDSDQGAFYFPNLDTGYASVRPYYGIKRQLQRLKAIADAEGKTIGVVAVNWMQGEADYGNQSGTPATTTTDYNCNGSKTEYLARLRQLHDDMWEDIQAILGQTEQPAWFVAQCSGQFVKSSFAINQALIDVVDNRYYYELPSTYPVPNKDDGHPTGNGYRWYGEYMARAMADILLHNEFPNLVKVRRIDATPNEVRIYCNVPYPPLRAETMMLAPMNYYGFCIRTADNSNNVSLSSVSIENDCIIIKPAASLSGTYRLHYATYYATGANLSSIRAAGNIADSDIYNANFVCMPEVTTAVEYIPLSDDGTPMQDKYYAMYNFLQPFETEITVAEAEGIDSGQAE